MPSHYDALFKRLFENPEVSADFARTILPADYRGKIDFESASIEPDTYVDKNLRWNVTDLLYDHKSSQDKWVSFQMLRYIMLIYGRELAKHPPPAVLPEIFPVVFYHVIQKWNCSLQSAAWICTNGGGLAIFKVYQAPLYREPG